MQTLIVFVVLLSSAVALGASSYALRCCRFRTHTAASLVFPLRATAVLSAIVALRAWLEMLPAVQALLAWFSTVALPVGMLLWPSPGHFFQSLLQRRPVVPELRRSIRWH